MTEYLILIAAIILAALLLIAATAPRRSSLSVFELNRRKTGVPGVPSVLTLDELREATFQDVLSLKRALEAVLIVLFVLSIVGGMGWLFGTIIAAAVALEYGALATLKPVKSVSSDLYGKYERPIIEFVHRYQNVARVLRSAVPMSSNTTIDSKQELQHMIDESRGVLSDEEKKLIAGSLTFEETLVESVMTPRSVVETIKKGEILGPMVLDDLHKTGHSRFPVVDDDIDHVIGILHVKDILTLDTTRKSTAKVESAMDKRVFYVRENQTLAQALPAFLSTHHHLFIVINEYRETVGILTLEDTLEALLGRTIVDEFDAHDDMRAVAARQAASGKTNNRSEQSKDI